MQHITACRPDRELRYLWLCCSAGSSATIFHSPRHLETATLETSLRANAAGYRWTVESFIGSRRAAKVRFWQCALKARITCGGRSHPENCRLIW
jgi:hypothetical protein